MEGLIDLATKTALKAAERENALGVRLPHLPPSLGRAMLVNGVGLVEMLRAVCGQRRRVVKQVKKSRIKEPVAAYLIYTNIYCGRTGKVSNGFEPLALGIVPLARCQISFNVR